MTIPLTRATNCQLVIVAWGNNVDASTTNLSTGSLSEAMDVTYPSALIQSISTDAFAEMKGMPYVLHLKNVNVIQDGSTSNGFIQSGTSEVDARIWLKRMATLLTLNWNYNVDGYALKQILLQSIPMNFRVIPNPDAEGNYPSLVDQFTTIQLSDAEITSGRYSRWIPANVRGDRAAANSITNRYKATAPQGSVFVNFIATNTSDAKKKLDYRVYVGGTSVTNFDVRPNTNYTYQVNFAHTGIPLNDKRVTYIDPIPASTNNNNFVPTSNCFMVAPGGSFNFDPTKMRLNGSDVTNTNLTGGSKWGDIASVKLLWQTKENGDVGDPVMGIVNTSDDHSNIVQYNSSTKRIYCRVAPNTSGGSGLIAAYDNSGKILWSWHVWVTDYNPDPTGNFSVDTPTKRKQKYTYNGANQLPMMDRNLGANAGYTTAPPNEVEKSKTNGFHYQWGRKDPFPGSYTEKVLGSVTFNPSGPTQGMLNYYQPDGITFYKVPLLKESVTIQGSCQNPSVIYNYDDGVKSWYYDRKNAEFPELWGDKKTKTLYDPCPAGWRIPTKEEFYPLFSVTSPSFILNILSPELSKQYGGAVVYFENNYVTTNHSTYLRATGFIYNPTLFSGIGKTLNYWSREPDRVDYPGRAYGFRLDGADSTSPTAKVSIDWHSGDVHPARCIQERQ